MEIPSLIKYEKVTMAVPKKNKSSNEIDQARKEACAEVQRRVEERIAQGKK